MLYNIRSGNINNVEFINLIYEAGDYIGEDVWNAEIDVEATIFKDGKWPRSNGTVSDKLHLTSIEGNILNFNN